MVDQPLSSLECTPAPIVDRSTAEDRGGGTNDFSQFMVDYISQQPNVFGSIDLLCLGASRAEERTGQIVAPLLCLCTTDKKPAVVRFHVILPPGADADAFAAEVLESIDAGTIRLRGKPLDESERQAVSRSLRVTTSSDLRTTTLLDTLRGEPGQSVTIVVRASYYRDEATQAFVPAGQTAPLLPEDFWAPHLRTLTVGAALVAAERETYIVLDAGQFNPTRQEHRGAYSDIVNCAVIGAEGGDQLQELVAARVDEWTKWMEQGFFGRVWQEVDAIPDDYAQQKLLLRIQLMHKSGQDHLAFALIKSAEAFEDMPPAALLKLAEIASEAGSNALAAQLLARAIPDLMEREYLELGLSVADSLQRSDLEITLAEKLESSFPDSLGLKQYKVREYLANRDYAGAAAITASANDAKFFTRLAETFGTAIPDYLGLMASAGEDTRVRAAYQVACVADARSRKLVIHALDLSLPLPTMAPYRDRMAFLLLGAVEDALLAREVAVPLEKLWNVVGALIDKLADDPSDKRLRVRLGEILDAPVAGFSGVAILCRDLLHRISQPTIVKPHRNNASMSMEELLQRRGFLEQAFRWLEQESPFMLGRVALPKALMTEPADDVVSAITKALDLMGERSETDDNVPLYNWLAVGCAVAPHGSDPDQDIVMINLVAARLASGGNPQGGRDLAEQAIDMATTPRRRRLAWLAMADVYNRCGNQLEALISMNCALACQAEVSESELWSLFMTAIRILRDNHLLDFAGELIDKARHVLKRMGLQDEYDHRLETTRLHLEMQAFLSDRSFTNGTLAKLLVDVLANARMVLERNDSAAPVGVMLGQLLRLAREHGAVIPHGAEEVMGELVARTHGTLGDIVRTHSAAAPLAEDLLRLAQNTKAGRYSDDVGYDMRSAAIAAERSLASDAFLENVDAACLALELLADRGVALPGWDGVAEPPPVPTRINEPAEFARSMSRKGISVLLMGFDANGRVVRQSAVDGQMSAPVREPEAMFLEERFRDWSLNYPYMYGIDEETPNLFFITTDNLRLSELPEGPVVVVADTQLQAFPPNILQEPQGFAGERRPMAAVPSLSWLRAAWEKGLIGDGRYCAWISTAEGEGESKTLPMIAERLAPVFEDYGFAVDNGPLLPKAFRGATLVVVTAHGGVHPDGRYFQVVSDEGELRVSAADLAAALRNVGVVILFVCSGGRTDKHPGANTTLGLAKELLDRGCAAVIASPWPLDSRVPSHWLPVFLESWESGETAMQACWAANMKVLTAFAQDPARGLALTVFGNPLLRKQP